MILLGMLGYILQVENLFCFSCLFSFPLPCQDLYFLTFVNFALMLYFSGEVYEQNENQYNEQYNIMFSLETHKSADWWSKWSISLVFKEIFKIRSFQTFFLWSSEYQIQGAGGYYFGWEIKNICKLNNCVGV